VLDKSVSSAVRNLIAGTIPEVEQQALNGNVGGNGNTPTTTPTTTPSTTPATGPTGAPPPNATVTQLLALAQQASEQADAALRAGDLAAYAQDIARVQTLVRQANLLAGSSTPTTAPGGGTTTTSRPKATTTTVARA
jgi:hypothetical protein